MDNFVYLDAQLHVDGGDIKSRENWWKLEAKRNTTKPSILAKSGRDFLESRHFTFLKSSSLHRLRYLCTRAQRGLISYDKRPVAELRRFCTQRGIQVPTKVYKIILVLFLERDDEQVTFPRFMELPPELRVMVYGFSFNVLRGTPRALRAANETLKLMPPPVTLVSRTLRKESLPLFYVSGTLELNMVWNVWWNKFECRACDVHFFHKAPMLELESVTALNVDLHVPSALGSVHVRTDRPCSIRIDLPNATAQYKISYSGSCGLARSMTETEHARIDRDLHRMMSTMRPKAKGGRVKLQRSDVDTFCYALSALLG